MHCAVQSFDCHERTGNELAESDCFSLKKVTCRNHVPPISGLRLAKITNGIIFCQRFGKRFERSLMALNSRTQILVTCLTDVVDSTFTHGEVFILYAGNQATLCKVFFFGKIEISADFQTTFDRIF